MTAQAIGRLLGPLAFAITVITAPPAGMPAEAWLVAGLVVWMAAWWMTEAVPLTVTALLPFVVLPFGSVSTAREVASTYYSPILFLLLGGAFIALAIERTGLHKRLSLAILRTVGSGGGQTQLLLAFMISAALLSMLISNTSTSLIMMPMALAVLSGGSEGAPARVAKATYVGVRMEYTLEGAFGQVFAVQDDVDDPLEPGAEVRMAFSAKGPVLLPE